MFIPLVVRSSKSASNLKETKTLQGFSLFQVAQLALVCSAIAV
jgi:hypothetical protein